MKIIYSAADLRHYRKDVPHTQSIGFVPTMGALHKGHLSLIESSLKDNERTIVSIFVNPTQFGANEDFSAYPRNIESDISLCKKAGVSAVFIPDVSQMYGLDETSFNPPTKMGYILEGFDRPTHFAGVLQVVLKLFMLISPHRAYFGQKDAQQVLLIKKMVSDLFLPIEIIPCPIQRDDDGLALSSRNIYLNAQERQRALCIPRTIMRLNDALQEGERDAQILNAMALSELSEVDRIFYAGFFNHHLESISYITKGESLFLLAVQVGKTRLLDNLWI